MRVYISADIEGVAGIAHWDEATKTHADYQQFREQMTQEVAAACEGALNAGATEVLVKDAHWTGRNIIPSMLPDRARVIRSWGPDPFCMLQELDQSFRAVLMIGYHSGAGANANPLAHTIARKLAYVVPQERLAA